ncbi:MAG: GAF domain-containing sensor histidine kinase [Actinomycetota bacterium]|nr:GAF domain-containing sensor histidine kinase [Actinomycetota bacterium]
MNAPRDDDQTRRLLDVGRALLAELDPQKVLDLILEQARDITGARYAALGMLNEQRTELERFVTSGIDQATRRSIGDLPRGRGVLGVLIKQPRPLRLADVGAHPSSYGFPAGHPPMHSFLGLPIMIRGEAWGNLYLAEKTGGEFTEADEDAAGILAGWAATAIENARVYQVSERRRQELERAVHGLEATSDIVIAIGAESNLDRVLELIAKRGRALVDAQSMLIMLRDGTDLVIAAVAGKATDIRGLRLPIDESTSGHVLQQGRSQRIVDVESRLRISPARLGVPDAHTGLLVPMIHRDEALGVLAAFNHGADGSGFTADDERLMRTFAATAANAVVMARSVEAGRLRSAIAAADAERARWARDLHDQTLQSLGGLRVLLAAALRRAETGGAGELLRQAIEDTEQEIANLRAMISDLRPSMLDDFGLLPALQALLQRRGRDGLNIVGELTLPDPELGGESLEPELETTIYRLVQEALTNVVRHAQAQSVRVTVAAQNGEVTVEVQDDGVGFDIDARASGFGVAGMRERVYLAGGVFLIKSSGQGTLLRARLAAHQPAGAAYPSAADQGARPR